jgi:hypothetical protein
MEKRLNRKALEKEAAYWERLKKSVKDNSGKSCLK